jgi:alginate O-acetyltransferase complex protein AlgJ
MWTFTLHSITRRLAVATYFAAVLLPVLLLGYDGPWLGPGDISIRGKASFPSTFSPGFYGAFDLWFADHLGLRYPLIYAGTSFHIGLLHRPVDRRIVFGREGWLFWTDDGDTTPAAMADTRGKLRLRPGEIKRIDAQLRSIHEQLATCAIPVALLVVPNKQSIYGEFLINRISGMPPSRFDALLRELSPVASEMIVDPRPLMREAKLAHAPVRLYNKTDTHWNDLGAYYGYVAVMRKFGLILPGRPESRHLMNTSSLLDPMVVAIWPRAFSSRPGASTTRTSPSCQKGRYGSKERSGSTTGISLRVTRARLGGLL